MKWRFEKGGMKIEKDNRTIHVAVRVTEAENALIEKKMETAGIANRGAYLRKMILDGYVIRVDFADVRELVRLLRNATNNLNQVAKRANETQSVYASDIKDLQDNYEKLWVSAEGIMKKLAKL